MGDASNAIRGVAVQAAVTTVRKVVATAWAMAARTEEAARMEATATRKLGVPPRNHNWVSLTDFAMVLVFKKLVVPTRKVERQAWTVVAATFRADPRQKRAHHGCRLEFLAQIPSQRCKSC